MPNGMRHIKSCIFILHKQYYVENMGTVQGLLQSDEHKGINLRNLLLILEEITSAHCGH